MTTATHIGRYAVLERVGAGGMAEVFRCRQGGLGGFDKTVIIKRILPNLLGDPEFINMFLDEARLAANLNHPNIVQVYEIDEADGVPFIVMEYVKGPTLSQVLRAGMHHHKLHFGHVARLLSGVCEGLAYAHNATDPNGQPMGIVHRDVSPQNVIVSLDGTPKLLDFGVAKAEGRLATSRVGTLKGKLRFMAPEQISSADGAIDQRADVYSIGVCLYLGTVGRLPFRGETDVSVLNAVMNERLVPPSEVVPDYPAELERLVLWAMARKPDERCPDATTLQHALDAFVSTGPHASTRRAVATWLTELELDKGSAVSGQLVMGGPTPSSGQLVIPREGTPVSARIAKPPELDIDVSTMGGALTPATRGRTPLVVGGAALVVLLAAVLVVVLRPPAASPPAPLAPVAPVVATPLPPSEPSGAQKNAAAQAYVTEAQRLLGEHRYKSALELVERARKLEAPDAQLNIALARVQDEAELASALARARDLLAHGDLPAAVEAAREVLDRDAENAEARALIASAQPKAKPAPVVASQAGSLVVTAKPDATVYLDDEPMGRTPLRVPRVAAGAHAVELRAFGYAAVKNEVKVGAGKEARVTAVLVKAAPIAVATPPEPKPEPPPEPRVELPSAKVEPTAAKVEPTLAKVEPTPAKIEPVAVKKPRLPAAYSARNVKDLARVLSVVEGEAVTMGGQPLERVAHTTSALMEELGAGLAPGQTIELFPRGMYYLIVKEASKGTPAPSISEKLKTAHLRNELIDYQP